MRPGPPSSAPEVLVAPPPALDRHRVGLDPVAHELAARQQFDDLCSQATFIDNLAAAEMLGRGGMSPARTRRRS